MSSQIELLQGYEQEGLLKNGRPRLEAARSHFLGERDGDLQGLIAYFEAWRDFPEYMVLQNKDLEKEKITAIAVKCSKRGNDIYQKRLKKRLDWMNEAEDVRFFEDEDISEGLATTKMIFFTLTWGTRLCSLWDAWNCVGSDYNRWISRLRSIDPGLSVLRVWQDFANGYPHIHGVILFDNLDLHVAFKQEETVLHGETHTVYRIREKELFEGSWHSFVDIAAVHSLRGALSYCKRYLTREISRGANVALPMYEGGSQSCQGLALMWIFRKRSFAVSGRFRSMLADSIRALHNSKSLQGQYDLQGAKIPSCWLSLGVHSAEELDIDPRKWFHVLDPGKIDPSWVQDAADRALRSAKRRGLYA